MFIVADQVRGEPPRVFSVERARGADRRKLSADFDERWFTGREKEIADLRRSLEHRGQQGRRGEWRCGGSCGCAGCCCCPSGRGNDIRRSSCRKRHNGWVVL